MPPEGVYSAVVSPGPSGCGKRKEVPGVTTPDRDLPNALPDSGDRADACYFEAENLPLNPGGLSGSTQHVREVYLRASRSPKFLGVAGLVAEQPCPAALESVATSPFPLESTGAANRLYSR
jgi:hypothetical protein